MSFCISCLVLVGISGLVALASTAPLQGQLVKFHPISRAQYDAIVGLTDTQPALGEARLIGNGFRTLSEWRSTLTDDLSAGWDQFLHIARLQPMQESGSKRPNSAQVDGYPVCVIKTSDWDQKPEHNEHHGDESERSEDDADQEHEHYENYEHLNEYGHINPGHDSEDNRPVINCVVVVKQGKKEQHSGWSRPNKHNHSANNENNGHKHSSQKRIRADPAAYPYPYGYYPYPYYSYPYTYPGSQEPATDLAQPDTETHSRNSPNVNSEDYTASPFYYYPAYYPVPERVPSAAQARSDTPDREVDEIDLHLDYDYE